jgi:molybdopterin/thiamine biosynthesis adenylyltransferase
MLTHLFQTQVGQAPGMVSSCRRIHLIGAGGNGAPMLMRLHKMHSTLLALGEQGLDVTVWDMDTVSRFNLGRQPFYPADIGRNKAQLLVDRLKSIDPSIAGWTYEARPFDDKVQLKYDTLMVITCVDNKAARRCVHKATIDANRSLYWLDLRSFWVSVAGKTVRCAYPWSRSSSPRSLMTPFLRTMRQAARQKRRSPSRACSSMRSWWAMRPP